MQRGHQEDYQILESGRGRSHRRKTQYYFREGMLKETKIRVTISKGKLVQSDLVNLSTIEI